MLTTRSQNSPVWEPPWSSFSVQEKLAEITEKLTCPPDTPAAVVYHASWADQKIVRGTIADIAHKARDEGIEHTALLIVGRVVDPRRKGYMRSYLYS